MNHWLLLVQIGVGGIGALLFLSALADAFSHEEKLFTARKLEWDREQADGDDDDDEVYHVDPQPAVVSVPPVS